MFDVIIIGKGPAGISAALYTLRANLKTLIIGKESLLQKASNIENYYGIFSTTGEKLLQIGEEQVRKFGAQILNDQVLDIKIEGDAKKIVTKDNEFYAKAVLIATGDRKVNLKIENIKRFEGCGISYCTTCDGFFFRGKRVGVLGYNDYAVNEALELANITNDITIFTNGNKLQVSSKYQDKRLEFKINDKEIKKFEGDDSLERICFKNGEEELIDGLFIAYGNANYNTLAKKLGILEKDNYILVNSNGATNVDGIFAAGDCTGIFKQISVAVGQGAIAGNGIIKYIKK